MADSFHDLSPHPRHRTPAEVIPAVTYPALYRVICPDGRPHDDVDTAEAALEAAKWADAMHDNAICDGRHRILLVHTYTEVPR